MALTTLLTSVVTALSAPLSVPLPGALVGASAHLRLTIDGLSLEGDVSLVIQGSPDGKTWTDIGRHSANDMVLLNADGVADQSSSEIVMDNVPAFLQVTPTGSASFTLTVEAL